MATVDVIANRSTASEILGKAYFETDTNSFIVYNGIGWVELQSDGTGSAALQNRLAASFDGTNDFMEIPTGTFDLGTSNWAFSFWFKFDSAGTYGLLDIGNSGGSISVLMMSATSLRLTAYSPANNVDFDATVSTMATDTWHHFLLQKYGSTGGSQTKMYLNGVLIKDGIFSSTTNFGTNTNTSSVGKLKNYFDGFNLPGNVDEFAYFSNSLSDGGVSAGQTAGGDVASIYNSGVPATLTSYSPAGWWRMGDDSNDSGTAGGSIATITDSSGNGNDASQSTASNQPTFKALDQSTTSLSFDGSDHLDTGSSFASTIGAGATVSCWFKRTSGSSIGAMFGSFEGDRHVAYVDGAALYYLIRAGNVDVSLTLTVPEDTNWHHFAAVIQQDGSNIVNKGYVDGVLAGTNSNSGTLSNFAPTVNMFIGKRNRPGHSSTLPFTGHIDDVAIFGSELSASEVASLAASRGAHIVNDLSLSPTVYYRMGEDDSLTDGASASQITDASGNGNHATQATAANQPTASVSPVIYV